MKNSVKYSEINTSSIILNKIILNFFENRKKKKTFLLAKIKTVSTVDLTTAMTTVGGRME